MNGSATLRYRATALGLRTLAALFMALVAAILGAMPGWGMSFTAWLVFSWFVLGGVVVASLGRAIVAAALRRWTALRIEGRQVVRVSALMLAMLPLGRLAAWVELAAVRGDLVAQAQRAARNGGPLLATTSGDDALSGDGILYDASGEIDKPAALRSAGWRASPAGRVLQDEGECLSVQHLVGFYYRWRNSC